MTVLENKISKRPTILNKHIETVKNMGFFCEIAFKSKPFQMATLGNSESFGSNVVAPNWGKTISNDVARGQSMPTKQASHISKCPNYLG